MRRGVISLCAGSFGLFGSPPSAAGIRLFVNQRSSLRLSSGVFTIPPTHTYRSLANVGLASIFLRLAMAPDTRAESSDVN